ncbi:MAG TPA: M48 family metallopeptidase [Verrucomicrobiae bacterium]|nr:M48 family metallopeptidase [Verrucomicrobiae bacterium]
MNGTAHGFEAELFHPGLGNEVVHGRVFLESRAVVFRSDATSIEIPVEQLLVELGEDEGRVYFRDRKSPGLRIFTRDLAILDARGFAESVTIRNHLERAATRREVSRRLRIMAYAVAGCVLLGWLGVFATHLMVLSLVAKVPPEWEQKFGDEEIAELKNEGVLLNDSNRVARLARLVAPLLRVVPNGNEFKFHIVESEVPNAFALPGGHVVVNTGLLAIADNEELVGVIAHEAAHITQKHHARKIIASAGPVIIFGTFFHSRNGLVNLVGQGSELMLTQGFSQEYETEADETGWNYLVQANLDPRGMIGIFKKLKAGDAKDTDKLPQAFQSHPALDKRIARLETKWKKLHHQSGFLELEPVDLKK